MQPAGYSHFVATETPTEISHECHFFTTKQNYCSWGDAKGFGTTDDLNKYEQLMNAAQNGGIVNDVPSTSFSDLYFSLFDEPLEPQSPNGQDAFCYANYFWSKSEQCDPLLGNNCWLRIDFGLWRTNRPYVAFSENNTFSSWKGDVSTGCTGHKKAELKGYDNSWYRDQIGTITTQGDVFTPFLNIYADFDNRISSFRAKSKN